MPCIGYAIGSRGTRRSPKKLNSFLKLVMPMCSYQQRTKDTNDGRRPLQIAADKGATRLTRNRLKSQSKADPSASNNSSSSTVVSADNDTVDNLSATSSRALGATRDDLVGCHPPRCNTSPQIDPYNRDIFLLPRKAFQQPTNLRRLFVNFKVNWRKNAGNSSSSPMP